MAMANRHRLVSNNSMDEPLSPILMVDSPHSTSFAQRNATAAAGSASRAMPDSPSVLHSRSSFFVIQDDQCPLGTKIGKLWKRHRANRIYETFFFKTVNEHLYYYKWKFEAENQEQPRGAYSLVGAEVVRKGKNIFLYVEDSTEPKRMFCMEERKAREWENHLKNRIAWSTPLPGAKRRQLVNDHATSHTSSPIPFPENRESEPAGNSERTMTSVGSFHADVPARMSGRRRKSTRRRSHADATNGNGAARDSHSSREDSRMYQDANELPEQTISLPLEMKYSYSPFEEIVLSISKLTLAEIIVSAICIFLLVVYYIYAPSVLADHFANSKMFTILGSLGFLAVLSLLVQVVFKTSIITELEEGGYI